MKQVDAVEKELIQVQKSIKGSRSLRETITSPIINKKVMANALKEVACSLNYAPATVNLLMLLAENGRMKKIDGVINSFKAIMAAHRGEVVCEVVTAKPMDGSQRKQLEDALKVKQKLIFKRFHYNKMCVFFLEIRQIKRNNSFAYTRGSINYWWHDCIGWRQIC